MWRDGLLTQFVAQDMETFQRMNALDADALRRIFRKFQEVDRVRLPACVACQLVCSTPLNRRPRRTAPAWWM